MEEDVIDLKDIGNILRKRLAMIITIVLIAAIGAIGLTYFVIEPTYTTSATLLVGKAGNSENGTEYSSNDVQLYQKLMATYAKVAQSEDLVQRAIERDGLNLTAGQVLSSLTVTPGTEDQILTLSYNSKNPQEGVEVLNPLIEEFKETSSEIISNGELFVLTTPKIPSAPSAPNKKMNIMIGIVAGLAVGVAIALFLEWLDDSVKTQENIESLLEISVIGAVPVYKGKWGSLDKELPKENNKENNEVQRKNRSKKK